MSVLWATKETNAGAGLLMRYVEQVKDSCGSHWRLFREVWDLLTLQGGHWIIVGLLAVLCLMPIMALCFAPADVRYYFEVPLPSFTPSLSQELALSRYYGVVGLTPPYLWSIIHHWVLSEEMESVGLVLSATVLVLVLVADLRVSHSIDMEMRNQFEPPGRGRGE